jgi:hypothetical protein
MIFPDDDDLAPTLPKRVLRTGIALVHEGELVLPAAGSEATAERVGDEDRAAIHFHFPVEIEVRGTGEGVDVQALTEEIFARLWRRVDEA